MTFQIAIFLYSNKCMLHALEANQDENSKKIADLMKMTMHNYEGEEYIC